MYSESQSSNQPPRLRRSRSANARARSNTPVKLPARHFGNSIYEESTLPSSPESLGTFFETAPISRNEIVGDKLVGDCVGYSRGRRSTRGAVSSFGNHDDAVRSSSSSTRSQTESEPNVSDLNRPFPRRSRTDSCLFQHIGPSPNDVDDCTRNGNEIVKKEGGSIVETRRFVTPVVPLQVSLLEYAILGIGVLSTCVSGYRILHWLVTEAFWLLNGILLWVFGLACICFVVYRHVRRQGMLQILLPRSVAASIRNGSVLEQLLDPAAIQAGLKAAKCMSMLPLLHALRRSELIMLIDQMGPKARHLIFGKGGILRLLPPALRDLLLPQQDIQTERREKITRKRSSSASPRMQRSRVVPNVMTTSAVPNELQMALIKRRNDIAPLSFESEVLADHFIAVRKAAAFRSQELRQVRKTIEVSPVDDEATEGEDESTIILQRSRSNSVTLEQMPKGLDTERGAQLSTRPKDLEKTIFKRVAMRIVTDYFVKKKDSLMESTFTPTNVSVGVIVLASAAGIWHRYNRSGGS